MPYEFTDALSDIESKLEDALKNGRNILDAGQWALLEQAHAKVCQVSNELIDPLDFDEEEDVL